MCDNKLEHKLIGKYFMVVKDSCHLPAVSDGPDVSVTCFSALISIVIPRGEHLLSLAHGH